MFCPNCGNETVQHARFCSSCGTDLSPAALAASAQPHDWNMHVNILGWLFVGSGVLTAIVGGFMIFGGQIIEFLPGDLTPGVPFEVLRFAGSMVAP